MIGLSVTASQSTNALTMVLNLSYFFMPWCALSSMLSTCQRLCMIDRQMRSKDTHWENSRALSPLRRRTTKEMRYNCPASSYADYTQVHRSTIQIPFNLALSRHPPGPIFLQHNNVIPPNAHGKTSMQVLSTHLEARIRSLEANVDTHAKKSKQRYKHDYDHCVHETPVNKPGQDIFLGWPLLFATKDWGTNKLATCASHKLLLRWTRPFHIMSVQRRTANIDEHGIENTVTIDRVLLAEIMPIHPAHRPHFTVM